MRRERTDCRASRPRPSHRSMRWCVIRIMGHRQACRRDRAIAAHQRAQCLPPHSSPAAIPAATPVPASAAFAPSAANSSASAQPTPTLAAARATALAAANVSRHAWPAPQSVCNSQCPGRGVDYHHRWRSRVPVLCVVCLPTSGVEVASHSRQERRHIERQQEGRQQEDEDKERFILWARRAFGCSRRWAGPLIRNAPSLRMDSRTGLLTRLALATGSALVRQSMLGGGAMGAPYS